MAGRKVKNGEKNPWGQCLTRPVPKYCVRSGFWLVPENFCVSLPNQKVAILWVVSCVLTRNDIWSSVARHVSLGRSPRLCSRWKVPILAQNVRGENLTGKQAAPFAGIITVAYLKVFENIHRFTDVFWIQGDISLGFKIRQGWCSGESTRLPPFWHRYRSLCLRHMWVLRFLLILSLAPRSFSLGTRVSSPLLKNQHFQIPIQPGIK